MKTNTTRFLGISLLLTCGLTICARASEADIQIPDLSAVKFDGLGGVSGHTLMMLGIVICAIGALFGIVQYLQTKALPVHQSMAKVSHSIYETCKTYLLTQGKLLAILWLLIAACMIAYFGFLQHNTVFHVVVILLASVLGILGSYGVAWFGIRINTISNSRTAFSALKGNPLATLGIPLRSGMSIGLLLVAVELFFMICILVLLPDRSLIGPCFIGFAIGESLGASVLRICGGIFTKIADIGSDLMKIVFKLPEDDPKNPGVIADCTGDNAGDSVGPTADGFETYGVTGVALIAFLALALAASPTVCATLIIWLFVMRALMIVTSLASYFGNEVLSKIMFSGKKDFDFEAPLTHLVWITSAVSIAITFVASKILLGDFVFNGVAQPALWWVLSAIISCGTVAGALIPEFTKIFVSTTSRHVREVTNCSKHGGASLNILSGFVAGNFSAFWMGLIIMLLMFTAWQFSTNASLMAIMPAQFAFAAPIFAFGLVAFGFLGMGPVTIAVDSYGPVTDNAQSVYELSQIEGHSEADKKRAGEQIKRDFGFEPDFENAKYQLEKGDGAGIEAPAPVATTSIPPALDPLRLASIMLGSLVMVLVAATLIIRRGA